MFSCASLVFCITFLLRTRGVQQNEEYLSSVSLLFHTIVLFSYLLVSLIIKKIANVTTAATEFIKLGKVSAGKTWCVQ